MNLRELIPILESIAPPELSEDFDTGRIGLVLDRAADVRKIAVALDSTEFDLPQKLAYRTVRYLVSNLT
jgi:putative NIF3 family GTP cyclohydrolase 1 type 2